MRSRNLGNAAPSQVEGVLRQSIEASLAATEAAAARLSTLRVTAEPARGGAIAIMNV
jgi:hypothetical protein